ncbi:hypothetical protein [Nonomuraea salmonea]|uniref:hypothetical protein n=1 Tax=Nonomuraea salmonea TaxID=46181 RepID=UPI002FE979E8
MRLPRILIIAVAAITTVGAVLATPWLGMVGALLFPGTATYDPEFAGRTVFRSRPARAGLHGDRPAAGPARRHGGGSAVRRVTVRAVLSPRSEGSAVRASAGGQAQV